MTFQKKKVGAVSTKLTKIDIKNFFFQFTYGNQLAYNFTLAAETLLLFI